MGNTPNNNFPYPEATGLVKDGWEDIKDLATSIDTKLGVYVPATPGLTRLSTTNFSGVANQAAATNTFSSTYRNYKIILSNMTSSVNNNPYRLRLRISGTDTTTTSYYRFGYTSNSGALSNNYAASTNFYFGNLSSTATVTSFAVIDISNPQVATRTQISYQYYGAENNEGGAVTGYQSDTGSQFDAFNIYADSGNISGTMQIFGYNQ